MAKDQTLTGVERFFDDDEIIVSKTDLKGHLTYTNTIFLSISDYTEAEVIGQPHSIIRHPEMPRSIFNLLWETIAGGNEIFAYVNNRSKNGDNYWVYAHVTPSKVDGDKIVGYHSNRRVPDRKILDEHIIPLYKQLKTEEDKNSNRKQGMIDSVSLLRGVLKEAGIEYDEFIATVGQGARRGYR